MSITEDLKQKKAANAEYIIAEEGKNPIFVDPSQTKKRVQPGEVVLGGTSKGLTLNDVNTARALLPGTFDQCETLPEGVTLAALTTSLSPYHGTTNAQITTGVYKGSSVLHQYCGFTGANEMTCLALFGGNTTLKGLPDSLNLSNLAVGSCMFYNCSSLTSFNSVLPALTMGYYMFYYCTSLMSFNTDLPSLTNGAYMFYNCNNLTSFNNALSSLTDGSSMFYNCNNLTSFNSALPKLTTGNLMFYGCKLDLASVQRIVTTVPTYTSGSHLITIGVDSGKVTKEQQDAANAVIAAKLWSVTWQRN